jgi:hypothetical protein
MKRSRACGSAASSGTHALPLRIAPKIALIAATLSVSMRHTLPRRPSLVATIARAIASEAASRSAYVTRASASMMARLSGRWQARPLGKVGASGTRKGDRAPRESHERQKAHDVGRNEGGHAHGASKPVCTMGRPTSPSRLFVHSSLREFPREG